MKKIVKLIISILCIMILINFIYLLRYNVKAKSYSDMKSDADAFISKGRTSASSFDTSSLTSEFSSLGKILTSIGAGVLVAATTYMGILYLTSGPEAQGKLKGQLIGLVVSGVVIFGAYGIWSLAIDIFSSF